MNVINLTPHQVRSVAESCDVIIPASGQVARVATRARPAGYARVTGTDQFVPLAYTEFGQVTGLPAQQEGTIYVVSQLVAQAAPERDDLWVPGDLIRDQHGQVVGCRRLERPCPQRKP